MNSARAGSHVCRTHFSKPETIPCLVNELPSHGPEVEGASLSQETIKQVLMLL